MVVFVGVPAEFTVVTKEAGDGDVDVRVIDNNGKQVPVDIKDNKDGTYTVIYYPTTFGAYTVNITFNTESIPKSPFKVNVCQTNSSACRAYGPGLEKVRTFKIVACSQTQIQIIKTTGDLLIAYARVLARSPMFTKGKARK